MKVKIFFVALIVYAIWQNWNRIIPPDFSHIPEGEIFLYTVGWCGKHCEGARDTLTRLNVVFEEIDIEFDERGKEYDKKHDVSSYPVIVYGDYTELGYGEKAMIYILNERYPK